MKKLNIMLVDDHQIIIDGIKALLKNEKDISVIAEANNGMDAIAILQKQPVDIVLMDIEMPLMNGCDATAIITSQYPDIKVIALTTFDEKSLVSKMLKSGAKGYLLKNISKEILLEALSEVANGKTYYSSEIPVILAKPDTEKTIISAKSISEISVILSKREIEVLKLIANGFAGNEIAAKLFISPKTVETHRSNIMQKLNLHSAVALAKFSIKSGLIS